MHKLLSILALLSIAFTSFSQGIVGCSDTGACNYDPEAQILDINLCVYDCVGCMDPLAVNYEATATISNTNGCCYDPTTYFTFTATSPLTIYATDLSGNINALATYPSENGFCLDQTCFTLYIQAIPSQVASFSIIGPDGNLFIEGTTDQFGYFSSTISNGGIAGCLDANACNYNSNATCNDLSLCNYDCTGCTDPNAPNYNPNATIDDGSCCSEENWATATTNVNAYIHIWGASNGVDLFVYTQANIPFEFCLEDGCYLYEAFGSDPALSTIIVIQKNGITYLEVSSLFTNSNGNFSVNATPGCPDPTACNYNPESTCPDWLSCTYNCQGCTDPLADNYDPNALVDNGTCCYNQYTVQYEGIGYWYITNDFTYYTNSGENQGNNNACLSDGCYFVGIYLTEPNLYFSVTDPNGQIILEGTTDETGNGSGYISINPITGCTDPYACNFDPEANCNDYTLCSYACYGCSDPDAQNFNPEVIYDNGSCCYSNYKTVELSSDSYWSVYALTPTSYNYVTGIYPTNNSFCLEDGCFQFSVFNFLQEPTTFTIYNADGSIFYSGTTDELGNAVVNFSEGDIYGCTDTYACNYDPAATCSDWYACNYDCYGCTDPNAPNYDPTATLDDGTCCTNDWYTIEMSGAGYFQTVNYAYGLYNAGNYPENTGFCQASSCFGLYVYSYEFEPLTFTITDAQGNIVLQGTTDETGYFVGSVGINNEIAGCTDVNACNYNPEATCNSSMCVYYCGGCTDPAAINFNANAQYEDGSCFYTLEPPMMQLFVDEFEAEEQYFVRLDMMSTGNGAPYMMSNDVNTEMIMVENNGQYIAGPFPCGEDVVIKLNSAEYGMMEYVVSDPLNGACAAVSVIENETLNTLSAYPNPSNGLFTLNGISSGKWNMQIVDITGRIVESSNFNSTGNNASLELSNLSDGQYQLIFTNETQILTTKIVINK